MQRKGVCADEDLLTKFCQDNNIGGWFYSSPKDNINIEESTNCLIKQVSHRCFFQAAD